LVDFEFNQSKEEWDGFLEQHGGTFLQSYDWGEFRKEYQRVWRIAARAEGQIKGVCQVMEEKSPFGHYLYIPHGPIAPDDKTRNELFRKAGSLVDSSCIAIKAEPIEPLSLGWKSRHRIQPQQTLISEIKATEEDILKEFDGKARYNVRLAQRRGVTVEESDDLKTFYDLMRQTAASQNFNTYPYEYFQNLLHYLNASLFLAYYQQQVVAGTIVVYFGHKVTFLHSASNHKFGHLKAPYLIRFTVVAGARSKGGQYYDNWGISQQRFPGVTSFKKGFGGQEFTYPPGREISLKRFRFLIYYFSYWFLKKY